MGKRVYSMLAEQVVFSGTENECAEYMQKNNSGDNQLYLINEQ